MRCKYCNTRLDFFDWLFGLGECRSCRVHRRTEEENRQKRESETYWKLLKLNKKRK